jgi:predicted glycosyltransferase
VTGWRVFFYVQHLLGVGHLFRAARIAQRLRKLGFTVDLVLGGTPPGQLDFSGLNVIQLPPLKAGPHGFTDLITPNGEPASPAIKARRIEALLAALERSRPDVLLIETFPFGRRQMRFELMPLLEAAHRKKPRPCIASSIRDILQESGDMTRAQDTVEILHNYFDLVFVHGDPRLVKLDATFPLAVHIKSMIVYSGIVAPDPPSLDRQAGSKADVVVSAGGGAVGYQLLETAILAKASTPLASARWLALTGGNAKPDEFERLQQLGAMNGVVVERSVPDLAATVAGAQLSISQAGYNTVADILVAGCRAVFAPFAQNGETEQSRRAALLAEHGWGVVVPEQELTTDALSKAIDRALSLPKPMQEFDLNGAASTAQFVRDWLTNNRRRLC